MTATIGVNTFVWYSPLTDENLRTIIPRVAGWGFETIELVLENPGDWNPELAAELVREHGIQPAVSAVVPPGRNIVAASHDEITRTQDYYRHCVDVARVVGARIVGGPMYTAVGRTWRVSADERRKLLRDYAEGMKPVADAAGEAGVVLAVEALNRYETSFINTTEQLLEAIDPLPAESVGLLFDTYHANIEEKDPAAALRSAAPRLRAMQVCANDRGTPGEDHIDWTAYGKVLHDIDYQGAMSIETFTPENEIIATAASIWRQLAPSPDALAQQGLAFLKQWRSTWAS
ncbi:sugar phosphate isomerase/epimerase family protein [Ornithinimicrobium cryptoxanthini]|uniref:Sugar phosphate isomerase/epimerase n=1 Tax=Ornithinimicrobium cryptoxanthini TaxID=2934161 RepID=A0ABY4YF31_9MICO|nr:sugar phosphate isomerase/epimerase family protein [Ornithinimicrobium cryptoxanthini]USQ75338.1 sugar phosphate isomerase/epimerase [Ornithinimicrobium cryptoxanthini]